ncbi:hypothetical protein ACFLVN_03510 [Chloroflexota bacterium]
MKGIKPRELTAQEIKHLEQYMEDGAARAKKAGFDGVMIHSASGYLVCEFLSPICN